MCTLYNALLTHMKTASWQCAGKEKSSQREVYALPSGEIGIAIAPLSGTEKIGIFVYEPFGDGTWILVRGPFVTGSKEEAIRLLEHPPAGD